jgi:hypothetical protein
MAGWAEVFFEMADSHPRGSRGSEAISMPRSRCIDVLRPARRALGVCLLAALVGTSHESSRSRVHTGAAAFVSQAHVSQAPLRRTHACGAHRVEMRNAPGGRDSARPAPRPGSRAFLAQQR